MLYEFLHNFLTEYRAYHSTLIFDDLASKVVNR